MKRIISKVVFTAVLGLVLGLAGCGQKEKDEVRRLSQDNDDLQADIRKLENNLDDAEKQTETYKREAETLRNQLADARRNVTDARRDAQRGLQDAQTSARRDREDLQRAHADELKRLREQHEQTIARLQEQINSMATRPVEEEDAEEPDDVDQKKLQAILDVYNHHWSKAAAAIQDANYDSVFQDATAKTQLEAWYNHCIAQTKKIEPIVKGMTNTAGPTWTKLEAVYLAARQLGGRGSPWHLSGYKRVRPSERSTEWTVEELFAGLQSELQEQKKQIEAIPVQRKSGRNYRGKVVRAAPLVR